MQVTAAYALITAPSITQRFPGIVKATHGILRKRRYYMESTQSLTVNCQRPPGYLSTRTYSAAGCDAVSDHHAGPHSQKLVRPKRMRRESGHCTLRPWFACLYSVGSLIGSIRSGPSNSIIRNFGLIPPPQGGPGWWTFDVPSRYLEAVGGFIAKVDKRWYPTDKPSFYAPTPKP